MRNVTFGYQKHIYTVSCVSWKAKCGEQLERELTPNATTKIQQSLPLLLLLEVKTFHSGSTGLFRVSGEEKAEGGGSFLLCLVT